VQAEDIVCNPMHAYLRVLTIWSWHLQEMRGVIEFDGSYVNYRHLAILCEVGLHPWIMLSWTMYVHTKGDCRTMPCQTLHRL
jgi:hypothetical protein